MTGWGGDPDPSGPRAPPTPLECYTAQSSFSEFVRGAYTICILPIFNKTRDRSATLPSNAKNDVLRKIEGDGGFIHPMLRWDKITPRNGDRRKTLQPFSAQVPFRKTRVSRPPFPKGTQRRWIAISSVFPGSPFPSYGRIRSRFRIGILNGTSDPT